MPGTLSAVTLLPLDLETLDLLATAPEGFARANGLALGGPADLVREVARQTRMFAARAGAVPPWGGFLALDAGTRTVVGTCSYKGPPDATGAVEIAYFTFPGHERRGYATAMADALRTHAVEANAVRLVRAHTLPERNASVRVLEKLGFRHLGQVIDPEDGAVWRWEWTQEAS
jgi:RimJ/RimL family protein N-acetyltransferase